MSRPSSWDGPWRLPGVEHDDWSAMGEEHLGEVNVRWGMLAGWLTLQKAIMNDYWTDRDKNQPWDGEMVDMVMSKLYYCWVRMLIDEHGLVNEGDCLSKERVD